MNVYQLHNRHAFPYIVGNFTFLSVEKFIVFCLRDGYVMVRIFYKNMFVGRLRACCMTACVCPTLLRYFPRTCPNTATEIGSVDGAISWLSSSSRNLKAASTKSRHGHASHLFPLTFHLRELSHKIPYFSIDNAHLMYNAHPNFFDIPFDV